MKKRLLFLLAGCCLCSAIIGTSALSFTANAQDTVTVDSVSLTMIQGASVRYVEKTTEEDVSNKNGLRFMMTLPIDEYEALESSSLYTSVSYGMCIAPDSYTAFTAENVFGANGGTKLYDWATVVDGVSTYEPETNDDGSNKYTRITNLFSPTMYKNEKENRYELSGSITGIKESNLDRKFQGLGYIAYTTVGEDGNAVTNYRFAENNDNVRSITYVAQLAADNNDKKAEELAESYIEPVSKNTRTYNIKHYMDGEFETTTSGTTTIDARNVSIDTDDYSLVKKYESNNTVVTTTATYDSSNEENVTTIKKVYADVTPTFKKYYTNKIITATISENVSNSCASVLVNNASNAYKVTFKHDKCNDISGWNFEMRVHVGGSFVFSYQITKAEDGTVSLFWRNFGTKIQYTGEQATTLLNLLAEGNLNGYLIVNRNIVGTTLNDTFSIALDIAGDGKYVMMTSASKQTSNVTDISKVDYNVGIQKQNKFEGTCSISFQKAEENYAANINASAADMVKIVSGSDTDTETGFTVSDATVNTSGVYILKLKYANADTMINNDLCALELRVRSTASNFLVAGALLWNKTDGAFYFAPNKGTATETRNNYANLTEENSLGADNTSAITAKLKAGTYTVVIVNDTTKENNLIVYADNGTGTLVKVSETKTTFNLFKFGFSQTTAASYKFGSTDDTKFLTTACGYTAYYYKNSAVDLSKCSELAGLEIEYGIVPDAEKTVSGNSDTVTGFSENDSTLNQAGIYIVKMKYNAITSMKNNSKAGFDVRTYTSSDKSKGFYAVGSLLWSSTDGFSFTTGRNVNDMVSFDSENTDAIFEKLKAGTYTAVFVNDAENNTLTIYADNGTGTLVEITTVTGKTINFYYLGFSKTGISDYNFSDDSGKTFSGTSCGYTAYYYQDITLDLAALTGLTVDCL